MSTDVCWVHGAYYEPKCPKCAADPDTVQKALGALADARKFVRMDPPMPSADDAAYVRISWGAGGKFGFVTTNQWAADLVWPSEDNVSIGQPDWPRRRHIPAHSFVGQKVYHAITFNPTKPHLLPPEVPPSEPHVRTSPDGGVSPADARKPVRERTWCLAHGFFDGDTCPTCVAQYGALGAEVPRKPVETVEPSPAFEVVICKHDKPTINGMYCDYCNEEARMAETNKFVGGRFVSQEHLERMQSEVAELRAQVERLLAALHKSEAEVSRLKAELTSAHNRIEELQTYSHDMAVEHDRLKALASGSHDFASEASAPKDPKGERDKALQRAITKTWGDDR